MKLISDRATLNANIAKLKQNLEFRYRRLVGIWKTGIKPFPTVAKFSIRIVAKIVLISTISLPIAIFSVAVRANALTVSQPVLSIMILPKLSNGYSPVSVSSYNSSISSVKLFPIPNFETFLTTLQKVPSELDAYIRTYTPSGTYTPLGQSSNFNAFIIEAVYAQDQPTFSNLPQEFLKSIGKISKTPATLPNSIAGVCSVCETATSFDAQTANGNLIMFSHIAVFSVNGVDYFVISESSANSIGSKVFDQVVNNQKNYAVDSGLPKVSVTIEQPSSNSKTILIISFIVLLALVLGYFWYRAAAKKSAEISRQMAYKFRSGGHY